MHGFTWPFYKSRTKLRVKARTERYTTVGNREIKSHSHLMATLDGLGLTPAPRHADANPPQSKKERQRTSQS